jgi:hypothetical protein
MTFSFYHSLITLPRELDELSRNLRLTRWMRLWKIEVPHAAIGLVWNGMMSFGGGWFFHVASEAITVANDEYTLPGVGAYAGAAIVEAPRWGVRQHRGRISARLDRPSGPRHRNGLERADKRNKAHNNSQPTANRIQPPVAGATGRPTRMH